MENINRYIEYVAMGIEVIGIIVIVVGTIYALTKFIFYLHNSKINSYKSLRHDLGKSILLGLEILVAGDIVATVVTEPSMENVLVLGVIVLIRTFLSLSIEVEMNGKLPWKNKSNLE